jgi:hypothetical protein
VASTHKRPCLLAGPFVLRRRALERRGAALFRASALEHAIGYLHERGVAIPAQLANAEEPGDEHDCQYDDDEFLPTKQYGEVYLICRD